MSRTARLLAPALMAPPLLALAALSPVARGSSPLLVNESASLPRGLYVRIARRLPRRGEVVAAAQPASARAYLAGLGVPASVPLLKRAAGLPGDRICATPERLDTPLRAVVVLSHDRRGVALPHGSGCRRLGPDELVLLGDAPTSFDSRYFGPVPRATVTGVYREVLRW